MIKNFCYEYLVKAYMNDAPNDARIKEIKENLEISLYLANMDLIRSKIWIQQVKHNRKSYRKRVRQNRCR